MANQPLEIVQKDLDALFILPSKEYCHAFTRIIRNILKIVIGTQYEHTTEEMLYHLISKNLLPHDLVEHLKLLLLELEHMHYSRHDQDYSKRLGRILEDFKAILPLILQKVDEDKFEVSYNLNKKESIIGEDEDDDKMYDTYKEELLQTRKRLSAGHSPGAGTKEHGLNEGKESVKISFQELFEAVTELSIHKLRSKNFSEEEKMQVLWDLHMKYCLLRKQSLDSIYAYYESSYGVKREFLEKFLHKNRNYLDRIAHYMYLKPLIEIILYISVQVVHEKSIKEIIDYLLKHGYDKKHVDFVIDGLRL